jgi:hypothetical protein
MNFRARLSLFALESRETPSTVPPADPYTDPNAPPSTDPVVTAPPTNSDPIYTADGTVPPPSGDPLTDTNSLTKTPIVP